MLRSTYHVFDLYVNYMGDEVLECDTDGVCSMQMTSLAGKPAEVDSLDILATRDRASGMLCIAAVNKDPEEEAALVLRAAALSGEEEHVTAYRIVTVNGPSADSYNDRDHTEVTLEEGPWCPVREGGAKALLSPHSVNVIQLRFA